MRRTLLLATAFLATTLGCGAAWAVNTCKADTLSCPTTMPVGGYCECTAHGATQSGTAIAPSKSQPKTNATAGGCGVHPGAPGCR